MNQYETRNGPCLLRAILGPQPGQYLATIDPGNGLTWTTDPAQAQLFPSAAHATAAWRADPRLIRIAVTVVSVRDIT